MSLYYVNDHLIVEENMGQSNWAQNNGEAYTRIMIKTTPMATKRNEETKKFESISRPICAHNCSLMSTANTRISSVQRVGTKAPRVTIRTSSDTRYDSDIFVVAIPYDGLIMPMASQNTEALQIFKCLILKSDQFSIEHEDKKYKRVAYFVVRPNYNFMGHDGWYSDDANLVVSFAQSNRTRENQSESELSWNIRTVTIRFGENGQYEIKTNEEEAPYSSINPEDLRHGAICKIVEPTMLDEDGRRMDGKNRKSN